MDKNFYGLVFPKQLKNLQAKPKSIFDSSDEDDEASTSKKPQTSKSVSSKLLARNKNAQNKLLEEDPTIYEYDSVYDSMKQKQVQKEISAKKEGPKYITSLLKAAEKRKKEQERRQERKIQIDREKEGNEFKDKEAFVTSAYKKKMMEMQEEEELEKLQDRVDEMMDVTKQKDLSGFYRHYLKQTVGEEAVPGFGDRESEIRTLALKTEPGNIKESSSCSVRELKRVDEPKSANIDADSYSSSEGELSDTELKLSEIRENLKSQNNSSVDGKLQKNLARSEKSNENRQSPFCCSSSSELKKLSDTKRKSKHRKEGDVSVKSTSSKSVNSNVSSNNERNKRQSTYSVSKTKDKKRSYSSDSSENSQSSNTNKVSSHSNEHICMANDETSKQGLVISGEESDVEASKDVSKKSKHDISVKFIKRTVGEVFDRAQSRYFKRMAAKN